MRKIFLISLFIILTPVFAQEQVQEDLEMWGVQSSQTNNVLTIEDAESFDLFELSYNLSYTMNALETILERYNEDLIIEYLYEESNIIISSEWFDYYLSLESDREKRRAIENIIETIESNWQKTSIRL